MPEQLTVRPLILNGYPRPLAGVDDNSCHDTWHNPMLLPLFLGTILPRLVSAGRWAVCRRPVRGGGAAPVRRVILREDHVFDLATGTAPQHATRAEASR
jgi:hypothetical protein